MMTAITTTRSQTNNVSTQNTIKYIVHTQAGICLYTSYLFVNKHFIVCMHEIDRDTIVVIIKFVVSREEEVIMIFFLIRMSCIRFIAFIIIYNKIRYMFMTYNT